MKITIQCDHVIFLFILLHRRSKKNSAGCNVIQQIKKPLPYVHQFLFIHVTKSFTYILRIRYGHNNLKLCHNLFHVQKFSQLIDDSLNSMFSSPITVKCANIVCPQNPIHTVN